MSDRENNNTRPAHEEPIEAGTADLEERAAAARLGEMMDALERGRGGLDDLPNVGPNDPAASLVPTAHALWASGPRGELSETRREAVWGELQQRMKSSAVRARRVRPLRARWWALAAGLVGAAAAAAIVFAVGEVAIDSGLENKQAPRVPAMAQVDAALPHYAAKLQAPGLDPVGDTRLRELRAARFDAMRTDTSRRSRQRLLEESR